MVHTTNGGASWSTRTWGVTHLFSVYFTDMNNGWVVGQNGTIIHTTDGGTTWSAQTSGTADYLQSVYFTDANNGWVSYNYGGTLLHTTDGGATWSAEKGVAGANIYSVYFTDINNGWIVGSSGQIKKYTESGDSSDGSVSFDLASTVSVTGNTVALNTTTAGKNYSDNQTLASVQSNCDWELSLVYPNFVRNSDGAIIQASGLTARRAGSSDPYAALPTSITGVPTPTPAQLSYDMCLDVPWTIAPSPNDFVASTTLTVVPAP
jgi:hypothetical protein